MMKRKIFFTGILFVLSICSFAFSQKITKLAPDTLPPADLKLENTPQFIFIGCDDNASTAFFDMVRDLKNPQGSGQKATFDGAPVRFSFYLNYFDKKVIEEGHEFGLHTVGHPFISSREHAINEFSKNLAQVLKKDTINCRWENILDYNIGLIKTIRLCDTIETKPVKVTGVRAPYLYVSDWVFDALDELDLRYDCSLEEGMSPGITSPNGFVWPYTADNGASPGWLYLSDTVGAEISAMGKSFPGKGVLPNKLTSHPGKWLIPAYPFFVIPDSLKAQYGVGNYGVNVNFQSLLVYNDGKGELGHSLDGTKISGLDFDMRSQGWTDKQAAMTLLYNLKLRLKGNRVPLTYCIHGFVGGIGLKEFIDSALTYPDVRFVTGNQLIDWMENPVGLDGTVGGRTLPKDTIETSVKQTKFLQNKGFFAAAAGKSLNISVESGKLAEITVFDTRGRIILKQSNVKNNTNIPFTNKSGIYFVKAIVGKNIITQKIVSK